jgi:hypothetical protein
MRTHNSKSFVGTFDPLSVADMQQLATIKKSVAITNKFSRIKHRVVLRGRAPIKKMYCPNSYYRRGSTRPVSYDWGGNIIGGIENASKYDVYIYERR